MDALAKVIMGQEGGHGTMAAAQAFPGQGHSRDEEVSQLRLSDQWNGILTDGVFPF